MSKNIIIQEGGIGKQLTADKLKTNVVGGGTCLWAPEAGEVNSLIKIDIGKNAEIEATDYNAYAITEVNVTNKIADIEIQPDTTKEGLSPYIVSIKEGDKSRLISGVKKLRVNLQSGGTTDFVPKESAITGELYATELGRYIAKTDGYIGYSRVSVNLSGDDWGDLPDEIKIITPPYKTTYDDGESIDITGMVVQARKNGEVWENDKYVDGIIPLSEIELSSDTANLYNKNGYTYIQFRRDKVPDDVDASYMPDVFIIKHGHYGRWVNYHEWGPAGNRKHKINYRVIWAGISESVDDIISTIFSNNIGDGFYVLIGLNDSPFSCYTEGDVGSTEEIDLLQAKQRTYSKYEERAGNEEKERQSVYQTYVLKTIEGKKVNFAFVTGDVGPDANNPNDDAAVNVITASIQPNMNRLEYAILYSILFGDREIELKWKRPRDNATLSTMLHINISNGV